MRFDSGERSSKTKRTSALISASMIFWTCLVSLSKPFSTVKERSFRARSDAKRKPKEGQPKTRAGALELDSTFPPFLPPSFSARFSPSNHLLISKGYRLLTTSSLAMSPVSTSSVVLRLNSNHIVLELPVSSDPRMQVVSVVPQGFGLGVACNIVQVTTSKRRKMEEETEEHQLRSFEKPSLSAPFRFRHLAEPTLY